MIKKKSIFKSFLIMVILFQKSILSSWNETHYWLPSNFGKHKEVINNEKIKNQIIDEEEIEIISDEKTKLQEIERSDCLFCASGYEDDSPYSIEVEGTIAQKRAHKPHEDFWHYGCILQYIEYGNKKCPYCTYALCLKNLRFGINSFIPAAQIYPQNRMYQIQEARRFDETRIQFGDYITGRPQNRRSRSVSEILFAIGSRFEECWENTYYTMLYYCNAIDDCLDALFDFVVLFFKGLFGLVCCVPAAIGFIIMKIAEDGEMDCEECAKCWCSWFCIAFVIFIIHALITRAIGGGEG